MTDDGCTLEQIGVRQLVDNIDFEAVALNRGVELSAIDIKLAEFTLLPTISGPG
jgi:hypothetical protein